MKTKSSTLDYTIHPAAKVINAALIEMIENSDIEIKTYEGYIAGYLIKKLDEAKLLKGIK